jgi:hypothetical protein
MMSRMKGLEDEDHPTRDRFIHERLKAKIVHGASIKRHLGHLDPKRQSSRQNKREGNNQAGLRVISS